MISIGTPMRANPAVWMALPTILLVTLQLGGPAYSGDHYGVSLTAHATSNIFLLAPLAAFCGAWQGGRFQKSSWNRLDWSRTSLQIIGQSLLPTATVFGGILLVWTALTTAPQLPNLPILTVSILVVLAWACAGFALGFWVRPVAALPIALLFSYGWMVLPLAVEPLWLRHLNGAWFSCCSTDQTIAPGALLGAGLLAVGIMASAVLASSGTKSRTRGVLYALPVLIAFGAAAAMVHNLDADPAVAREGRLLCTDIGKSERLCLWPEHERQLGLVKTVGSRMVQGWASAGVAVPPLITEEAVPSAEGAHFTVSSASSEEDITMALASAIVPGDQPRCSLSSDWPGGRAYPYLLAFSASSGGMSPDGLKARFTSEILQAVQQIREKPIEAQELWFSTNLKSLQDCGSAPTGDIR